MAIDPSLQGSHIIIANGSSETQFDSMIIIPDNCQAELANSVPQNDGAVCENSSSNSLSRAFLKMCLHLTNTATDIDIDELSPPGFEKSETLAPLQISKIPSARSHECFPKISVYVALAMCRQKLHDDVLRECNSVFVVDSLNKFLIAWRSSKKQRKVQSMEVGLIDFFPCFLLLMFLVVPSLMCVVNVEKRYDFLF